MSYLVGCTQIAYPAVCRFTEDLSIRGHLSHEMVVSAHCGIITTVISLALAAFALIYASYLLAAGSLLLFVIGHDWCHVAKNLMSMIGPPEQPADLSAIFKIVNPAQLQEKVDAIMIGVLQNTFLQMSLAEFCIRDCVRLENNIAAP